VLISIPFVGSGKGYSMFGLDFLSYENMAWLAPLCALLALGVAAYLALWVLKQDEGTPKMQEISKATQEGALAFLLAEYKILGIFVVLIAIILGIAITPLAAVAFVTGAVLSVAAGFVGMLIATRANGRTAQGATKGIEIALKVAFRSGLTTGLAVAGFGLLGLSVWALIMMFGADSFIELQNGAEVLTGFLMGVSVAALFARVGGGIYTKAADVGADLVGKVEVGIPEDDPRNPAVIADNVGDNVGDVAGMGADLFESYVGALIGCIILGASMTASDDVRLRLALLPILLAAMGIIASMIGTSFVRAKEGTSPQKALNKGSFGAAILTAIMIYPVVKFALGGNTFDDGRGAIHISVSVLIGLVAGTLIGIITEYYTGTEGKPVKGIEKACVTGPATTIISGLGVGMLSTFLPIITIVGALIGSFYIAGFYGIGIAALGMLLTLGIQLSVDAYGPIADNAGGLAVMSAMKQSVRRITDQLDAVGNTTAAIGKGFAIGSAALTAIILISAFSQSVSGPEGIVFNIIDARVMAGLFLGGTIPFLFSALAMGAIGIAAGAMIEEVRRQFRERPGILNDTETPDYRACVDISTQTALKKMILPGLIAVISPILTGFIGGIEMLVGLLVGATLSGVLLAIFMANAGGAWDNAKKRIEAKATGKGTEAHKAAVVGDTVGDPFKDTAGPSLNTLIKLMAIIALVIAPMLKDFWR